VELLIGGVLFALALAGGASAPRTPTAGSSGAGAAPPYSPDSLFPYGLGPVGDTQTPPIRPVNRFDTAPAPQSASAGLAPVEAVVGAIPVVGSVAVGVLKVGAVICDALGLSGPGKIDPWHDPNDGTFAFIDRHAVARMLAYNPATGRFDNPEPLPGEFVELEAFARAINPKYQDATGVLLGEDARALAADYRAKIVIARAWNYDREAYDRSGGLPAPPPPPPPPTPLQLDSALALAQARFRALGINISLTPKGTSIP
jgi:hypothetical protein